jgi:hypothetical protein
MPIVGWSHGGCLIYSACEHSAAVRYSVRDSNAVEQNHIDLTAINGHHRCDIYGIAKKSSEKSEADIQDRYWSLPCWNY